MSTVVQLGRSNLSAFSPTTRERTPIISESEEGADRDPSMSRSLFIPVQDDDNDASPVSDPSEQITLRTLFVGELSRECTEGDLLALFSQCGGVEDVRLKYAKITKHPLGYGFVEMSTVKAAEICKERLNGVTLHGKAISVGSASRNKKLFVGNIARGCGLNEILSLFEEYGEINSTQSYLGLSENGSTYAVVEFLRREDAESARERLHGFCIRNCTMFVNWEQSMSSRHKLSPKKRISTPDSEYTEFPYFSVHVSFQCTLPAMDVDEKMLYRAYKKFGIITTVTIKSIFKDSRTRRQSGFGFLHFETIEGARNAVYSGGRQTIDGVQFIAEFSKHLIRRGEIPPPKCAPSIDKTLSPSSMHISEVMDFTPTALVAINFPQYTCSQVQPVQYPPDVYKQNAPYASFYYDMRISPDPIPTHAQGQHYGQLYPYPYSSTVWPPDYSIYPTYAYSPHFSSLQPQMYPHCHYSA